MNFLVSGKPGKNIQYITSISLVFVVAGLCFALSGYLSYQVVALILLLVVSVIAVSFDILPVLIAAFLSACIWNFFFIPPLYNFTIRTSEDLLLLIMYFVIALINAVLTYKIKKAEERAREKEEKENAVQFYNTLLSSLSHELKTPIAAIIGATDNLQSKNNNLTDSQEEELIEEISKASLRLNRHVENLLNVSRIEAGFIKAHKTWCDITEIIYDVIAKIEEQPVSQRITISINPAIPLFKTDKLMIEQITSNLINNARLYSYPGSVIRVSASDHGKLLQLIIEDDGPGFPPDELPSVFDKFYRLENTKAGGTGLGLSIVKGFTEALKGQVMVGNVNGGGAKFTVEIPCETSYIKVD
jgi:two-component system, OmpR family, sensor histidine kinase KdpD